MKVMKAMKAMKAKAPAADTRPSEDLEDLAKRLEPFRDAAYRPTTFTDADFEAHRDDIVHLLKEVPNPSELLNHVMNNLKPGRWDASIRGPNYDTEAGRTSVIQVHLKVRGSYYVTNLSEEGKGLALSYEGGTVNKQNASEYKWAGDCVAGFERAKSLAEWKFH